MRTVYLLMALLAYSFSFGQRIELQLANALKSLEEDGQLKHSLISLYVVDSKTGKMIFDKNSQIGLAPASCLKLVTSVTAFELLGGEYRYKTEMGYLGTIKDSSINGDLYFKVSGDPSLGSWRWVSTNEESSKQKMLSALTAKKITLITGDLIVDDSKWETQSTPRGWIWEDVGNYFGAGARGINWHENQYDLILKPGKEPGDSVAIIATKPELQVSKLVNELKTGKQGSGDNSIIYLPEDGSIGYLRGTVPAGKETFTISGSVPNTANLFMKTVSDHFLINGIKIIGSSRSTALGSLNKVKINYLPKPLLTILSPSFDSLNYWFLKESINLYGEALVKTLAVEKTKWGSTDSGIDIIKGFWSKKGVERSALNIIDGCGLSPANRVTTNALVTIIQYAKQQKWFPSFYFALPEYNGIKMKGGYIGGVRSYTGYIKSKTGAEYTFSFIINNFNGSPVTIREKMWKLLDILK